VVNSDFHSVTCSSLLCRVAVCETNPNCRSFSSHLHYLLAGGARAIMDADDAAASDDAGRGYVEQAAAVGAALAPLLRPSPTESGAAPARLRTCLHVRPPLPHEVAAYGQPIPGMGRASFAQIEYEACFADRSKGEVCVLSEERVIGQPTGRLKEQRAAADDSFGGEGDSDDVVFQCAVRPLVDRTLTACADGHTAGATGRFVGRSALLAFGQTGAGKTRTCTAMQTRAAAALLGGAGVRALGVSFLEICGEHVVDLLTSRHGGDNGGDRIGKKGEDRDEGGTSRRGDGTPPGPHPPPTGDGTPPGPHPPPTDWPTATPPPSAPSLALREVAGGELVVVGWHEVIVHTVDEAMEVLAAAQSRRAAAPTAANERSSRSHAICRLRPVASLAATGPNDGLLLIVDLAGSERREDLRAHSKARMEETRAANASLAALKECIRIENEAMGGGGGAGGGVVPYRRSKLTRLLRPYLERTRSLPCGSDRGAPDAPPLPLCVVIAHLSPTRSAGKHTASTLEFVHALRGTSRQEIERERFNRVERWSAAEVVEWVRQLDGGVYAHLSVCFGGFTGKLLSVEWLGHLVKRVRAEGGDEQDAHRIYEAFHEVLQAARLEAKAGLAKAEGLGAERRSAQTAAADGARSPVRSSGLAAARRAAKGKARSGASEFGSVEIHEGPRRPAEMGQRPA
jgi:hypothetical protein